jgi:hypothetical protein
MPAARPAPVPVDPCSGRPADWLAPVADGPPLGRALDHDPVGIQQLRQINV